MGTRFSSISTFESDFGSAAERLTRRVHTTIMRTVHNFHLALDGVLVTAEAHRLVRVSWQTSLPDRESSSPVRRPT